MCCKRTIAGGFQILLWSKIGAGGGGCATNQEIERSGWWWSKESKGLSGLIDLGNLQASIEVEAEAGSCKLSSLLEDRSLDSPTWRSDVVAAYWLDKIRLHQLVTSVGNDIIEEKNRLPIRTRFREARNTGVAMLATTPIEHEVLTAAWTTPWMAENRAISRSTTSGRSSVLHGPCAKILIARKRLMKLEHQSTTEKL
ncbi:hypothetical protein F511_42141 [Dorcoceras hygrometricum]|uniref:Uncharacterized protein n=1 Tax=Dorcoceras hygrometricum TaxID=472368 RepID=A0A2Z7CLC4_9LAMI|nr:hypothetical protein F511_42141 [Dorcoceras hygrometricum]